MISVVIPAYREENQIQAALQKIEGVLATVSEEYEILVIDDGSPDGTWQKILDYAAKHPAVKGFRLSRNYGKEYALCAGLDKARGDAVAVMDADLQHPPALLPEMIRLWKEQKYDVVEAVKTARPKESPILKYGAAFFYGFLSRITRFDFAGSSDYKLLDRKVIAAWKSMGEHVTFFRGMTAWLGFRRRQILFETPERASGKSGWPLPALFRLAINAATSFTSMPLRVVTGMGIVFLLFTAVMACQTMYMKLSGRAVSGFTTVILLILLTGSIIMFALGILGEYLAKIYEEVKKRPRYVVAESINA